MTNERDGNILGGRGGNAAAAGMRYQAGVGALFAVRMLAETPLDDLLGLAGARVKSVRFETNAPVDDILVETDRGGYVAIQAKTNVSLGAKLTSTLGSVAEQFARFWLVARSVNAKEIWARAPDPDRDRLLLAYGPKTSDPVRVLAASLEPGIREGTAGERRKQFKALLAEAFEGLGSAVEDHEIEQLLRCVRFVELDPDGADGRLAIEQLRSVAPSAASSTFPTIVDICVDRMQQRGGFDGTMLRANLARHGFELGAAPSYAHSINALQDYSARTIGALAGFEVITLGNEEPISLERECLAAVLDAARGESLLLTGEPGAGKSGILNAVVRQLCDEGAPVVMLAVDRLPVNSLDGLSHELGLDHSLIENLANWPGTEPAYLAIDALDASRGGQAEAVFRALMAGALALPGRRWRVIASIRSFDLRLGRQLRELFSGQPPIASLTDPAFPTVRHVAVPEWTDGEFCRILQHSRGIADAVAAGGRPLASLARVPFNTRLLGDLISNGVSPASFAGTVSQTNLLSRYWEARVDSHGAAATACLQRVVDIMLAARALRASFREVAAGSPEAVDRMEAEGVLVRLNGGRELVFRHHILFDYAASRLLLEPSHPEALAARTAGPDALALAPALGFVLTEAWDKDATRTLFWQNALAIAGASTGDPIARSVTARLGAELPRGETDLKPLIGALTREADQDQAIRVLRSVLGALSVRVEDKQPVFPVAWMTGATGLSGMLPADGDWVPGMLRHLLYILLSGAGPIENDRASLGAAARSLLAFALAHQPAMVPVATDFVCKTYDADPVASRLALEPMLDPERMRAHGSSEMPALAHDIAAIVDVDPGFATAIYGAVFDFEMNDKTVTRLGNSQIMPLTSTVQQDYSLARYSLAEAFPAFLDRHPQQAVAAMVAAIEARARTETSIEPDSVVTFETSAGQRSLVADRSMIWAWNVEDDHASDAEKLLQAVVSRLCDGPAEAAREVAEEMLSLARYGVVWSRLFYAGGRRPDLFGDLLWRPLLDGPFLSEPDTVKDAIDAAVAVAPSRGVEDRAQLENKLLDMDFAPYRDPAAARTRFLRQTLTPLREWLVTDRAIAWISEDASHAAPAVNQRPFQMHVGRGQDHPLNDVEAVDPKSKAGRTRTAIQTLEQRFDLAADNPRLEDPAALLDALESFQSSLASTTLDGLPGAEATVPVVKALQALLANSGHGLEHLSDGPARLASLIEWLAAEPWPEVTGETDAHFEQFPSWGAPAPRVDSANLIYDLLSAAPDLVSRLLPLIDRLMNDPHPAVRLMACQRLVLLWRIDRDAMWERVEGFSGAERNRGVLRYFIPSVVGRLFPAPDRMEPIVLDLWARYRAEENEGDGRSLSGHLAFTIGALWVWKERAASRAIIDSLLAEGSQQSGKALHQVAQAARDGLVTGYDHDGDPLVRERAKALFVEIMERTAAGIESQVKLSDEERDHAELQAHLVLLDSLVSQLRFGAVGSRNPNDEAGLQGQQAETRFLADMAPHLRRIGEVAPPRALHHLIELLDTLSPADPPLAFSLIAHGVLGAGRLFGYHGEVLGADLIVRIVGRMLADHREIFGEPATRAQLVEMLEVFTDQGWPAARRLLYELPDLFR